MIDINEVWREILDFNDKFFPGWREIDPVYYSNALAGEVGEVCGVTKKIAGGGTKQIRKSNQDLREECADVFIYLSLLLQSNQIGPEEFLQDIILKIRKNTARMDEKINSNLAERYTRSE